MHDKISNISWVHVWRFNYWFDHQYSPSTELNKPINLSERLIEPADYCYTKPGRPVRRVCNLSWDSMT